MTVDRRRYGRQMRLAEIGDAGQAKLCAVVVALRSTGFARVVEERYVRAAGMGVRDEASPEFVDVASALGLRDEAAREVGEGALAALLHLRAALEERS